MPDTQTERLNLSLTQSTLKAIDEWRRVQEDIPTRSEAARRLIEQALKQAQAVQKVDRQGK